MLDREASPAGVTDQLPRTIKVLVVAGTGLLRAEIAAAFDEDFDVTAVADARGAEDAAGALGPHALVVVADDLYNCPSEECVHRVRVAASGRYRVAVLLLSAHADVGDIPAAHQAGADDAARWPMDADMFRAKVRSLVRVATLESSMTRAAESGMAGVEDLRHGLAQAVHLINNSVAGVSGRAQLAALTGAVDESGLVPVCLAESRKVSLILNALHRLADSLAVAAEAEHELAASLDD
jgi:DNA-binding NarL/FixJ family response regulator